MPSELTDGCFMFSNRSVPSCTVIPVHIPTSGLPRTGFAQRLVPPFVCELAITAFNSKRAKDASSWPKGRRRWTVRTL